jgi:hypothetical protein
LKQQEDNKLGKNKNNFDPIQDLSPSSSNSHSHMNGYMKSSLKINGESKSQNDVETEPDLTLDSNALKIVLDNV